MSTRLVTKKKGTETSSKKVGQGPDDNEVNIPQTDVDNSKKIPDGTKKKTEELTKKLNKTKLQIEKEKNQTIQELDEINTQLQDKANEVEKLSDANQHLFKELNGIKNTVDEKMKFVRIFKFKEDELENKIRDLEKDIKLKKKQIENSKKMIEKIYKIEKESLETLLEKNGEETKNQLNDDLENLKDKIKLNENNLNELKKTSKIHRNCEIKKKNLNQRLKYLKNDLEYETKKSDLLKSPVDYSYKEELSIDNKFLRRPKMDMQKRGMSYSGRTNHRLRIPNHNEFKDAKEKQRKRDLNIKVTPIWKEFEMVNKRYQKELNNRSAADIFTSNEEYKSLPTQLFTQDEYNLLQKLNVPQDCLDTYIQRFNDVDDERINIEKNFILNKKKKEELKNTEHSLDHSSLKMKELNNKIMKLKVDNSKHKQVIKGLKQDVKEWETKLREISYFYNLKNKQNATLKKKLNELQEQIDNGELVLMEKYRPKDIPQEDNEEEENENEEDGDEGDDNNDED
jgi:chromosome segregation ATPase